MVNVLEHIEDDVAVLRQLHGMLRPGGAVLLFVPALPWLYGSLDELVHHVRRYTKPQLHAALGQAGLRVERLRYCDVLGIAPWWLAGRVLRRQRFDSAAAMAYDRFGVPLTRRVEGWMDPPLGKSLIAIATRPGGS
jgi:SAM-dependent methyltransferase